MDLRTFLSIGITAVLLGCGSDSKNNQQTSADDAKRHGTEARPASAENPPIKELVKAETGVGKQGQGLEQPHINPVIAQPAKSLFAARQRVVFDIQIPQALSLYRATNGYLPKSHDEFMRKIISENSIQLPELPAGQRYLWDAEAGELMVERPTR